MSEVESAEAFAMRTRMHSAEMLGHEIEARDRLVAQRERERCLQVATKIASKYYEGGPGSGAQKIVDAIRALKDEP